MQQPGPIARFERAVEAVIDGDVTTLKQLARATIRIWFARVRRASTISIRRCIDATLLHYLAANGVEGLSSTVAEERRRDREILLDAGADPNALSWAYGGHCTTMALLVSSTPPADAGVQVPLVETLIDYGASIAPAGEGKWTSPIETALVFGIHDAAQALVRPRRAGSVRWPPPPVSAGSTHVKTMLPSASGDGSPPRARARRPARPARDVRCSSMPAKIRIASIRQARTPTRRRFTRRSPPVTSRW